MIRTETIRLNFRVSKCFSLSSFETIYRYQLPDSTYGTFIFSIDSIPRYYFNCVGMDGKDKPQIRNIENIPVYLASIIKEQLGVVVDPISDRNKCLMPKDLGVRELELLELISWN